MMRTILLLFSMTVVTDADMYTGLGNNLFGHLCSYFWTFPNQKFTKNELSTIKVNNATCKAIQLVYVGRHGARLPEDGDFVVYEVIRRKILQHVRKLDDKLQFLKQWKTWPTKIEGFTLPLGKKELIYLGKMYGTGLFDLFFNKTSPDTITISGSHYSRVLHSAADFYTGLTEIVSGNKSSDINPVPNDYINQFFANCPNYKYGVQENKTHMHELFEFRKSELMTKVRNDISKRLGMNETLDDFEVSKIFILCATELRARNKSDWCDLQTDDEREVLNYKRDLEDYYTMLYGHPLIPKMACPMWESMFTSFDNAIRKYDNNEQYIIGDLHFGHTHTLDPFVASIGLFRDHEALRADNFEEMKNRTFYECKVMPSGGHVAFILYNCDGTGPENYVLRMMVNGKPMDIPGCGSSICPFLSVKDIYKNYIENCQWHKFCNAINPLEG